MQFSGNAYLPASRGALYIPLTLPYVSARKYWLHFSDACHRLGPPMLIVVRQQLQAHDQAQHHQCMMSNPCFKHCNVFLQAVKHGPSYAWTMLRVTVVKQVLHGTDH
jgi:hypothetical protein